MTFGARLRQLHKAGALHRLNAAFQALPEAERALFFGILSLTMPGFYDTLLKHNKAGWVPLFLTSRHRRRG